MVNESPTRGSERPLRHLAYGALSENAGRTLGRVQSFLDLEPRSLASTTRQQDPEPLRELIENYDELKAAFAGTPEAAFFD